MNNQVQGKIVMIKEAVTYSEKFTAQSVIIQTEQDYGNVLELQFSNERIKLVDNLNIGDVKIFNININGREWQKDNQSEKKYFVSLNCWSFDKVEDLSKTPTASQEGIPRQVLEDEISNDIEMDDDLPF